MKTWLIIFGAGGVIATISRALWTVLVWVFKLAISPIKLFFKFVKWIFARSRGDNY